MTQPVNFFASYSDEQEQAKRQLVATRATLLDELRASGVTNAELFYEGYDDDGNVEYIALTPAHVSLSEELYDRLQAFGWDFAYSYNPGLEIDCGGNGSLDWDLQTDKIDLNYCVNDEESVREEYRDQ
ncbi:hypothetical protein [Roseovarius sp. D0-M9]|uniref:hypothetical protein n=1 Tax=Roseovarius sp. D0-M9 TaxID=3127117 RepID=UPI003010291B